MHEENVDKHSLDSQLKACEQEIAQLQDKAKRLAADFENLERRTAKERIEWAHRAQVVVIKDILPIVDDVDRAVAQLNAGSNDAASQAFVMLHKSLEKFLSIYAVSEIPAEGELDPELHEAVVQVQSEKPSGSVVAVLQKGYQVNGTIIRPAKVSVAQ